MEQIRETVLQLAEDIFELDPDELEGNPDLRSNWGATSVSLLEFCVALERTFNIRLPLKQIQSAERVDEVVNMVGSLVVRPSEAA